jgi:hypothetical protein
MYLYCEGFSGGKGLTTFTWHLLYPTEGESCTGLIAVSYYYVNRLVRVHTSPGTKFSIARCL